MKKSVPEFCQFFQGVGWNIKAVDGPQQPVLPGPGFHPIIPSGTVDVPNGKSDSNGPEWKPGSEGFVPPESLIGGTDIDGKSLYIARARYGGGLMPGKVRNKTKLTGA